MWKTGDWTDDTDQMILIMDSLLAKRGEVSETNYVGIGNSRMFKCLLLQLLDKHNGYFRSCFHISCSLKIVHINKKKIASYYEKM